MVLQLRLVVLSILFLTFTNTTTLENCVRYFLNEYRSAHSVYVYEEGYYMPLVDLSPIWSYYIIKSDNTPQISNTHANFVLLSISNLESIRTLEDYYWNKIVSNTNRILVVYHGNNLHELFQKLRGYYFLDKVVILENLKVYTSRIITQGKCVDTHPVFVGFCGDIKAIDRESDALKFPNCTLRVSAETKVPYVDETPFENNKGLEVQLIRLIANKLNLNLNIFRADKSGNVLVKSDMHIGRMWYTNYPLWPVCNYFQEQYSVIVPTAASRNSWLNVLYIFDVFIWCGIVFSLVLVSLYWCKSCYTDFAKSTIFSLAVLISSVPREPINGKLVYVVWSVASMILVNSYIGLLVSFMFKIISEEQVSSLEGMQKRGWTLAAINVVISMKQYLDENARGLKVQYEWFDVPPDNLTRLNFGYLMSTRTMMYHLTRNQPRSLYKFLQWNSYLTILLKFGSVYGKITERYTLYIAESGITQKFDLYKWKPFISEIPTFQNVSLKHLYLIFGVFIIGVVLSIIAFLAETLNATLFSKIKMCRLSYLV